MFAKIVRIFTEDEVDKILDSIDIDFQDGNLTAGRAIVENNLKNNEEAQLDKEILNNLMQSIGGNEQIIQALSLKYFPKMTVPLIARYQEGMYYDGHFDCPSLDTPWGPVRNDFTVVLSLCNPDDYEGGESWFTDEMGTFKFKPKKGEALIYCNNVYHGVYKVTSGERLVAINWIQSQYKDMEELAIIRGLSEVHSEINNHELSAKLYGLMSKLSKKWSD